jgi:hypothetical protein
MRTAEFLCVYGAIARIFPVKFIQEPYARQRILVYARVAGKIVIRIVE